jgi:asparagine synthase (glutamine-hydrolysing)
MPEEGVRMCGISGIYSLDNKPIDVHLLNAMTDRIRHRGPDDEGYLLVEGVKGTLKGYSGKESTEAVKIKYPPLKKSAKAILGLGFRRLSILELHECGHQPMVDEELQIGISFNGEIYNYIELRTELQAKGYSFVSQSDTEVIIKAYHAWGDDCVQRFNGMWAFALWDGRQQRLFCSRDRYGIKPFYYALTGSAIYWGSEIKQLILAPIDKSLNKAMIWRSLKINSMLVYDDETYWKSVHSLKPGNSLSVCNGFVEIKEYYHLDIDSFEQSTLFFKKAVAEYQAIFLDAIAIQLRSDVPVGASLSGGMDSSAIVCSAVRKMAEPMHTFSSYYADTPALDERIWIDKIVRHTGGISHLVTPTAKDAIAWWGKATELNDLPIAAGFVSQYAVMQKAHETGIKVLLSGQGSDELSAGYRHASYRYFADLIRGMQIGKLHKQLHDYLPKGKIGDSIAMLGKIGLSALLPESELYKLEFNYLRFEPFNHGFTNEAKHDAGEHILKQITDIKASRLSNFLYNMMHNTSIQTLLHFEDRISMGNSVESRVPFLDHRLVDLVFSLPSQFKIKPPYTKLIHRQAMKDLIPGEIYRRKDKGIFSSPFYEQWMKGEMKSYLSDIIASTAFRSRGIWNLPKIYQQWQSYLDGDPKPAEMLYHTFALEIWFRSVYDRGE